MKVANETLEICNRLKQLLTGIEVYIITEPTEKIHFRLSKTNKGKVTKEALEDQDRFLFHWKEIKKETNKDIIFEELIMEAYIRLLKEKGLPYKELVKNQKEYLVMMQNNGVFDMIYNHSKAKDGIRNLTGANLEFTTDKGNKIYLESDENIKLDQLVEKLSDTQIQLLCYCIIQAGTAATLWLHKRVLFNINDYFKIRGIKRNSVNMQKLKDDFNVLSRTHFEFTAYVKGKNQVVHQSQVLAVTDLYSRKEELTVVFGDWIASLSSSQYSLINNAFFKYKSDRNHRHLIRISLKLSEIVRNNLKSVLAKGNKRIVPDKFPFAIKVENLLELLEFNEDTIKGKGYVKACQEPLENALDIISENEGYMWKFRKVEYSNFEEFKADFVEFNNEELLKAYKNYKLKQNKSSKCN